MASRISLIHSIEQYKSEYHEELEFKNKFLTLLAHPRAFFRDHLPGHITASSWIIEPSGKFTLLTLHSKLGRWLQPGGHADGEENVLAVAQREAREETGLTSLRLIIPQIFDLDIHVIPARFELPQHFHYDIRFLFQANMDESLIINEESRALEWIPDKDIIRKTGNNISISRMVEKVKNLSRSDQHQSEGDHDDPEFIDR